MKIAVIGLGYVGLPLAMVFAEAGIEVVGVEAVASRCDEINAGRSYIQDVSSDALKVVVDKGLIRATTDYAATEDCDADIICLPTPLNANREPDLTLVKDATEKLAGHLRRGQLVTLESTTYPGTTRDELAPILEAGSGLTAGVDFHLAFSPERVDPGRTDYTTRSTPKVVGGLTPACTARALEVYGPALDHVVPVSTPEVAEMTKLLENIFRSVNIALMNELAMLCDRMDIDVWEVIDAAATKPFGFMKFQPGPGLGGHCIPIDPFYLSWKAREFDFWTEFIELAGKVNENMPYFCVEKLHRALNTRGKSLHGAKVLVLGVAYKADIDDLRESPALKVIKLLRARGARVDYHDSYCPELPEFGLSSVPIDDHRSLAAYDVVTIVTAHSDIDYRGVVHDADLVIDFRNATAGIPSAGNVWKL
ncbi:MAG TPA: nucleotide sugar dehydrogenase [Thermoleophilia bacterium]|nr:nucleotide sugar dehydrogenase [Thermoleophilia bacterium]